MTKKRSLLALMVLAQTWGLSSVEAKAQVRPQQAVQVSVAAHSKGFELSYEYRPDFANRLLGFKGFVGYGMQKTTGGTWTFTTHYLKYNRSVEQGYLFSDPNHKKENSEGRYRFSAPDHKEVSLGGEVNLLLGGRNHAAEIGAGIAVDHFSHALNFYSEHKQLGAYPKPETLEQAKGSKWASHAYLRAGYRYTHSSGIMAGIGLNYLQLQGPFTYFYASTQSWMPYLTVGYAF
ncbi:MAG: hypothetical protein Q4A64_07180 [Porphyromonadaceae bacterium]|nr:hypothetical protein [Porphyromonadaceae bacterium]